MAILGAALEKHHADTVSPQCSPSTKLPERQVHPVSVDLTTGAIQSNIKMLHHFK